MAQHDLTDLVTRIAAAGGDSSQLLAIDNIEQVGGSLIAWNRRAEAEAYAVVERIEQAGRPLAATAAQLDYITTLGGTAPAGLTKIDASALIDQLKARRANGYREVHSPLYGKGRVYDAQPGATQYDDGTGSYSVQIWDN